MWSVLFIIFIILAFILSLVVIFEDLGFYWNTTLCLTAVFLWLLLASSVLTIEIPYTMYNSSSGNIENGIQLYYMYQGPSMVYLFSLFAIILFVYWVAYLFTYVVDRLKEKGIR